MSVHEIDTDVTGVVLAGGSGTRLGQDKTALHLPGMDGDFLARAITLLAQVTADVRVSCRADFKDRLARVSAPVVPDLYPGEGALRAVLSVLSQVRRPCLIIACDMPFLNADILYSLLESRRGRASGIRQTAWRQKATGYVESLAAVYEPECLPLFKAAAASGEYRLNRVIPPEQCLCLDYGAEQASFFLNINRPEDWHEALSLL